MRELEELTTLQQEQLDAQRREIYRLSSSVRSLQIQPRQDTPQGSGQREVGDCVRGYSGIIIIVVPQNVLIS